MACTRCGNREAGCEAKVGPRRHVGHTGKDELTCEPPKLFFLLESNNGDLSIYRSIYRAGQAAQQHGVGAAAAPGARRWRMGMYRAGQAAQQHGVGAAAAPWGRGGGAWGKSRRKNEGGQAVRVES